MFGKTISRFRISLRFERNYFSFILCGFYKGIKIFKKISIVLSRLGERYSKNILFLNGKRQLLKMVSNSPGGNRGCVIGDISRAMGDCLVTL